MVFGIVLTIAAGFGGYFARTWEFRQQVLEWVTPRGDDYVITWRDKESLFYIGFALIACMMLLAALCIYRWEGGVDSFYRLRSSDVFIRDGI